MACQCLSRVIFPIEISRVSFRTMQEVVDSIRGRRTGRSGCSFAKVRMGWSDEMSRHIRANTTSNMPRVGLRTCRELGYAFSRWIAQDFGRRIRSQFQLSRRKKRMMESSRINLDGTWNFIHVDDRAMSPVEVRQIHVPSPWQAQFRDLRTRSGTGIYGRTIDIAQSWLVPSAAWRSVIR